MTRVTAATGQALHRPVPLVLKQLGKQRMIDQLLSRFEGAYAASTIRAYRSDFADYQAFCTATHATALEPNSQVLADYINHMVKSQKKAATIQRRIACLSRLFNLAELPDKTKSADVVFALKRAYRELGTAQKQATPLTHEHLQQLLSVCDNSTQGERDSLMLRLGYETMRRRSEIVTFKFEDLSHSPRGTPMLRLKRSKTDQYGKGKLIAVSAGLAAAIATWQEHCPDPSGFILRRFTRSGSITEKPMCAAQINLVVQRLQKRAGLDHLPNFSGHSFRVGGALDLLERGVPIEKIMLHGGWKSETTALRYLRSWISDEALMVS